MEESVLFGGTEMENSLAKAMAQKATEKMTENGDKSFSTTKSACLDLFALGGSLRTRSKEDILDLWNDAEAEDPLTAYKILFFIRSVREGYGERRTFRTIWNSLDPCLQSDLSYLVGEVGRWDDLEESIYKNPMVALDVKGQLEDEYEALKKEGKSPSLLAKWLPCGKGNKTARVRTRKMAQCLGFTEEEYRHMVVSLRKELDLVESKMVNKEWSKIDYSKLPSLAGHKYTKAFHRNDGERYSAFLEDVKNGTAKINTSVLTPMEVLAKANRGGLEAETAEVEWKSLPDFLGNNSGLAMIDTSSSMTWCEVSKGVTPLIAASAMGIYFAERNKGPFKNLFMTFSQHPDFIDISKEKTLRRKFNKISNSCWGSTTNLRAAFSAILKLALDNGVPQEDMPRTLYIFSDMEFDAGTKADESTFEFAKKEFQKYGYQLPNVVFWNLCARNNTFPVQKNEMGVSLVSGYSPRIFKRAMDEANPEQYMEKTLAEFPYSKEIEILVRPYLK